MTGLMSQALANVKATEDTITALSGLPAAAESIVQQSSDLIGSVAKGIEHLQTDAGVLVPRIEDALSQAETALQQGKPLGEVKVLIDAANTEARGLETTANDVSDLLGKARNSIAAYSNDLAGIENQIGKEIAALNGELGNLKSKRDAAKKKYYWLIALGPFGVAGLAAALALYLKFKHDVDHLQGEINGKQKQVDKQKALVTAVKSLNGDFDTLVDKVSGIKNAVGFLSDDIGRVISDLEHEGNRTIIELFVKAAQTEAKEVAADVA